MNFYIKKERLIAIIDYVWYHIDMKIFCISDLHLSLGVMDKPMDVFGDNWTGHWDKIKAYWQANITDDDIVLIAGDTSWGMNIPEALPDLAAIDELTGKKYIIRGNHDYWWSSYAKIKSLGLKSLVFIQNNAFREDGVVICGTRGWTVPEENSSDEDKKIYDREVIRLKLTLESAAKMRQEGDRLIVMMHYPPFNAKIDDSEFTSLIKEYGADEVVYGHLHGKNARLAPIIDKNGIKYYLTSCDFLGFTPLLLD